MTATSRGEPAGAEASLSPARGAAAVITAASDPSACRAAADAVARAAEAAATPLVRPDVVIRPRTAKEVAPVPAPRVPNPGEPGT